MNSIAKRILTALWVAGAFAGLLAIIVLPGRYDSGGPVLAHTTAGVEIIDTAALVTSHSLFTADANADANPGPARRDVGGRQLLGLRRSHRCADGDALRSGARHVHSRMPRYGLDGAARRRVATHLG